MAPLPSPQSRTVNAIYAWHAASRANYRSAGIAVSELGTECLRAIFYRFRWADAAEAPDGRKARLFATGSREEARLVDELRAIGCEVWDVDPETGKQWPLRLADDHVRGKADGVVLGLPEAPKTAHAIEIKSHSAKNFRDLVKNGVREAFPKHYAQLQLGMHALGMTRGLYIATSKDTDELHAERLDHDVEFCLRLLAKAGRIVQAHEPPAKLWEDPKSKAAFACKFCPSFSVCHEGTFPDPHCRTCLHASPIPGGRWECARWGRQLTLDDQRKGCPAHLYLPGFVPGSQIDADTAAETVTYRLRDGRTWVDGEAREHAGEVAA